MRIKNNLIQDHSSTYTAQGLINLPHKIRLKECFEVIKRNIPNNVDKIIDFGGESGFLGDFLSIYLLNIKFQKIYDIKHPLSENITTKFYEPDLETEYYTFNMNNDNFDIQGIDSDSLIICSETLEHVRNPYRNSRDIIDLAIKSNCDLYISFPIERGIKGFIKFFIKLFIGRYKKRRTLRSILNQILWFFRLKKEFRDKKNIYSEHDGFDNVELTEQIVKYSIYKNIECKVLKGLLTIHIYITNKKKKFF